MTEVSGMVELLRSIASRLENGAGPLTRDFLEEVANKVERLETVARVASEVEKSVSRNHKKKATRSLVPQVLLMELSETLKRR
jgi:hypothetical protein